MRSDRHLRGSHLWTGHAAAASLSRTAWVQRLVRGSRREPARIGAIVAMPIIGVLTAKIDNRWLIAFGFMLFGLSSLWFGQVNLAISQWSFIWAIIISGFGTGCIFVPLSTAAMDGIPNEEIGNASGLYNLMR